MGERGRGIEGRIMTAVATGVTLAIDGRSVTVPAGGSVLEAVLAAGIDLPHLCKDDDMPAIGACRTCLVEIEGRRGVIASCVEPAREGMRVSTSSDLPRRLRRSVLDLTLGMGDGPRSE